MFSWNLFDQRFKLLRSVGSQGQKSTAIHHGTGRLGKKMQKARTRRQGVERGAVVSRGHGRFLHEGQPPHW